MLEHYRNNGDPDRSWCLVIAGDLVDFIGMSIAPATELETALNDEEHRHGLGSAHDHAVQKMRAVARRHAQVFDRLSRFIADGHRLVLVRGNHDVDFHWEQAQVAFVEALLEKVEGIDTETRATFTARIEFAPWFYYVEGLLYVEHGHQYDSTCSYEHQLAPVFPVDTRRIHWSFSDILMRSVVRPTRGLGSDGHDSATFLTYIRLAISMGFGGGIALAKRYVSAIAQMVAMWRAHLDQRARGVTLEHEARFEEIARRMRVGVDKVRAIGKLAAPPVTRQLIGILRALFVDRMAFVVSAMLAMLVLWLLPLRLDVAIGMSAAALISCAILINQSSRARREVFRYGEALRRAGTRIAELLPARFVVMGHTHEPVMSPLSRDTTYVNLGAWATDELTEGPARPAPCTHLVIRYVDGEPKAEFFTWDNDTGVQPLSVAAEASAQTLPEGPARLAA